MSSPENTPENREKLAQHVIEKMTIGEVMEILFSDLMKLYSENTSAFYQDYENYGFPDEVD